MKPLTSPSRSASLAHLIHLTAWLSLTALCACAEADEGRPSFQIEVSDDGSDTAANNGTNDTRVSTLSDQDLRNVCASYSAFVDAEISFDTIAYASCLPLAIVLGGNRNGCEQRLNDCMAGFPQPISIRTQIQNDGVCLDSLRACNGTVAQLESCVNVNLGLVWDILDRFSCREINENSTQEAQTVMNTASVCADLDARCTRFTDVDGLQ